MLSAMEADESTPPGSEPEPAPPRSASTPPPSDTELGAAATAPSVSPRRPSAPPGLRAASVSGRVRNPLWSLAAFVVVIYGLKEGQAVLVPVVSAALLAIIVSPGVTWLEARRVPKVAAVLAVALGMVLGLVGMAAMVLGSLGGLRAASREYGAKLSVHLQAVRAWFQSLGIPADLDTVLSGIEPGAAAEKAATVIIDSLGSLLAAVSNLVFVAITMVLILMESSSVPARLRALSDEPDADISYFRDIAAQVQSYLAIKTVVSVATGVIIGLWAALLGVDFAMLWGLLAFLLNYIPNIGSIIAAVPAMMLALIQHGVGTSLGLGAGYVVVNMILGNVVEPMWMGRKMGLSTTVVFVSLAVWYEIWGPVGMLLSVPLTMVIKIMLEHTRDFAFVAALLDGGEPASAPLDNRPSLSEPPRSDA